MPKALITGISGQDGSYLAEFLLAKGYEVAGLVRPTSSLDRIAHIESRLSLYKGDLQDALLLADAIQAFEPDEVYNLAALSVVHTSFNQALLVGDVTGLGAARVLDVLLAVRPQTRFFQASTSEMSGKPVEVPQSETTPFYPRSPYGVAKVYAHWMVVNYRETHGMHASCGITFNHESPRRGSEFVTRKVTSTAARIARGFEAELRLGNLDARRDWGFAGEYVEGMWSMLQQDEPDDYVLCTGTTHSVRDLCEVAFSHAGLDYRDHVVIDAEFYRPVEDRQLVGDPSKIAERIGWKAKTTFQSLVESMVDADLALVDRELASPALAGGKYGV